MKKYGWIMGAVVAVLGVAAVTYAGSIKTWSNGEVLSSTDLNANFNHIHGTMVGGHGARLVNADISTSAAISHAKLATPTLVPKAWAYVSACPDPGDAGTANPCTIGAKQSVSTITRAGDGEYEVTLSYTPHDVAFAVVVSSTTSATFCNVPVVGMSTSGPNFVVICRDDGGTLTTSGFSFIVMDDN